MERRYLERWVYGAFRNVGPTDLPKKCSTAARDACRTCTQVAMLQHEDGQVQERDANSRTAT